MEVCPRFPRRVVMMHAFIPALSFCLTIKAVKLIETLQPRCWHVEIGTRRCHYWTARVFLVGIIGQTVYLKHLPYGWRQC